MCNSVTSGTNLTMALTTLVAPRRIAFRQNHGCSSDFLVLSNELPYWNVSGDTFKPTMILSERNSPRRNTFRLETHSLAKYTRKYIYIYINVYTHVVNLHSRCSSKNSEVEQLKFVQNYLYYN